MAQHMPQLPLIDRFKIQAEVLVPILHHLEAEIGRDAALALLRESVGEVMRGHAQEFVAGLGDTGTAVMWRGISDKDTWERQHPIVVEERHVDDEVAEFDVTDCQYASFFNQIGEPELGFLLVCSSDFDFVEAMPDIELERTQTRMQGATHCDFRYRRSNDGPERSPTRAQ